MNADESLPAQYDDPTVAAASGGEVSASGLAIAGVSIGHWTHREGRTGCSVIVFPPGTVASGEIRGGAPASREFDLLDPTRTVSTIDAAILTGGSAFGLASADGAMRVLEAAGRGVLTPAGVVPIVPTLGLFDLPVGSATIRPDAAAGASATAAALATGNPGPRLPDRIGAGTGATTHKYEGPELVRPGGLGYAVRTDGTITVAVVVAVNAFGDIAPAGVDPEPIDLTGSNAPVRENTTIGVLITDAALDKVGVHLLAQGGHDGLARAINPAHTRFDGDGIVAASTGTVPLPNPLTGLDQVRGLAVAATAAAVRSVTEIPAIVR